MKNLNYILLIYHVEFVNLILNDHHYFLIFIQTTGVAFRLQK